MLGFSKYSLEPEVALLVDESVVEEDTVLVVDVGSGQLSDPLVGDTSISVSVDLGRDTPLIDSQPYILPWIMCIYEKRLPGAVGISAAAFALAGGV